MIATPSLRRSASAIDEFLAANAHVLPATYQFKLERFPVAGVPQGSFGSGGSSGFRLPGDADHWYMIKAGLNECTLTQPSHPHRNSACFPGWLSFFSHYVTAIGVNSRS